MRLRRFWKGYFFLMVVLTIGGFVLPFFVSSEPSGEEFEDLVLLPLYIAQLVGLFGFAYWRAIGTRRIWQLIFGATLLEAAWNLYRFATEVPPSELGSLFIIGLTVTIVPLIALLVLALYSYAFRAPDLWTKAT